MAGWGPGRARAEVRLSEFLADNADVIQDGDGEKSDYIEIYNPDDTAVNLAGYSLTVSRGTPRQWVFPDLILNRGQYLLVWASGKNRADPAKPLHTNFKLERSGGYLALIPPGAVPPAAATVYDPYPPQVTDKSYGLYQPEILTKVIAEGAACRWLVPASDFVKWRAPDYNDSAWTSAVTGIGFDASTPGLDYSVFLGAGGNTEAAMLEKAVSCYVRLPFQMTDLKGLSSLKLRVRYDDGYVAGLNATTVARGNAPDIVRFDSRANGIRDEEEAVSLEERDLTPRLANLRPGKNVLSFQVLNASLSNTDILLSPELELGRLDPARPVKTGFFAVPTPLAVNAPAADGFAGDTKFSMDRGIFISPFQLAITSETPDAIIRCTLDSSPPSLTNGFTYSVPLTIAATTVVRAAAFRTGMHPSNVDTQTYVFPASVIRQSNPAGYPLTWGTTSSATGLEVPVPADYAMDQSVVNDAAYSGLIGQALSRTLPVVSLAGAKGLFFDEDGIYANGREGSEEIPVSIELFGPGLDRDEQIDGGVRIHGGNAREHPKKPLRLYFRKSYGTDKLRYPVFPGSDVSTFNQLLLRPGGHDGWAVPFGNEPTILAPHASYTRDQFLRLTENDMGHVSPRGRYMHVYLNGLYWGIYDLQERPNADYYSAHYGGEPEDWDVIHHPSFVGENYSQVDGSGEAWDEVLVKANAGIKSDAEFGALASLIDLDSYIDALIVRIWAGDYDWCGPIYLKNGNQEGQTDYFDNKNWYAARRSRTQPGGFVFHSWDAEMSMGTHLMGNLFSTGENPPSWLTYPPAQDVAGFDSTRVGYPGSVTWPYARLRTFPAFQRKFADHLQRLFFNNGAMTTAANQARLDSLTAQLQLPIIAESARWGDVNRNNPRNIALTPNGHWKPEISWLRNTFMAGRNALVLSQFQNIGLFPSVPAPLLTPFGGSLPADTPLDLKPADSSASQIYYTLDGSDPSTLKPTVSRALVDDGAACVWWVPTSSIGTTWRSTAGPSNAADWQTGRNGLGYDQDTAYLPYFKTDTLSAMHGRRPGVYFRISFEIASQAELDAISGLTLEARYDDGLVAAVNGTVVQRVHAPAAETFSSTATELNFDADALNYEAFPIPAATFRPLLKVGTNVLAVQGLNQSVSSSDFLCSVRLVATTGGGSGPSAGAKLYDFTNPPLLSNSPTVKARTLSGGVWSALTEAKYITGTAASARNLALSELQYHPANPSPAEAAAGFAEDGDFEFLELCNISPRTIQLRGCRFTAGISFDFDSAAAVITEIAPGARLLVVKNPAAMTYRHGPGLPMAGAFADGTSLSNSGETLRLAAADGSTIFELSYSDSPPWPEAADGGGNSLVLINPRSGQSDPAPAGNWRAGTSPGGSPGTAENPAGFGEWAARLPLIPADPLGDPDGDGAPSLLEYASGTDPLHAASRPVLAISRESAGSAAADLGLRFSRAARAEDAALVLETAPDLQAAVWTPVTGTAEILTGTDGTDLVILRPAGTSAGGAKGFYRLRASLP